MANYKKPFSVLHANTYPCRMKFAFLFLGVMSFGLLKGEEELIPELQNLFEADLVVDANFKSQDGDRFYIIVNETILDNGYGIRQGHQLNLPREDNGCGGIVDFSYYKRRRYYLKKTPNGWRLNHGSTQSIKSVYSFGKLQVDRRFCGLSSVPPHSAERKTMNGTIRQFAKTYRFDEEAWKFIPLVDTATLSTLTQENIMIAEFEKLGRCCLGDHDDGMVEPVPDIKEEFQKEELPITYCDFMVEKAVSALSTKELATYLQITDYPHKEFGIEGRVYLQLTLNDSGLVSHVDVKRGINATLDSIAVEKAMNMPPWQPAKDQYGRTRSCHMILPFTFRLEAKEYAD